MLSSLTRAFLIDMATLSVAQQNILKKVLREYIYKNVSIKSPLYHDLVEILKIIEAEKLQ